MSDNDFRESFEKYNQPGGLSPNSQKPDIKDFKPHRHDYEAEFAEKYADRDEPRVTVMDATPAQKEPKTGAAGAGLSTAAFVLGVVSFFLVPAGFILSSAILKVLTFLTILAAVVVGIIALVTRSRLPGLAIAAIVLALLSFLIWIIMIVLQLICFFGMGLYHTVFK